MREFGSELVFGSERHGVSAPNTTPSLRIPTPGGDHNQRCSASHSGNVDCCAIKRRCISRSASPAMYLPSPMRFQNGGEFQRSGVDSGRVKPPEKPPQSQRLGQKRRAMSPGWV